MIILNPSCSIKSDFTKETVDLYVSILYRQFGTGGPALQNYSNSLVIGLPSPVIFKAWRASTRTFEIVPLIVETNYFVETVDPNDTFASGAQAELLVSYDKLSLQDYVYSDDESRSLYYSGQVGSTTTGTCSCSGTSLIPTLVFQITGYYTNLSPFTSREININRPGTNTLPDLQLVQIY